jgi:Ca2+-transporting ATPase
LHREYEKITTTDIDESFLWYEYPLDGKPMMTHVFQNKEGKRIIAAKVALKPSKVSDLNAKQKAKIYRTIDTQRCASSAYIPNSRGRIPKKNKKISFCGTGGFL